MYEKTLRRLTGFLIADCMSGGGGGVSITITYLVVLESNRVFKWNLSKVELLELKSQSPEIIISMAAKPTALSGLNPGACGIWLEGPGETDSFVRLPVDGAILTGASRVWLKPR